MKKLTFLIFLIISIFLLRKMNINYNNYKTEIINQTEFLGFLMNTVYPHIKPDKNGNLKEEKKIKFINWINMQCEANGLDISNDNRFHINYDRIHKVINIYKTNKRKTNLSNTPFNLKSSNGFYSIKNHFFFRYLFTYKYCVVYMSFSTEKTSEFIPAEPPIPLAPNHK